MSRVGIHFSVPIDAVCGRSQASSLPPVKARESPGSQGASDASLRTPSNGVRGRKEKGRYEAKSLVPVRVGAAGALRAGTAGAGRASVLGLGAGGGHELGPARGHGAGLIARLSGGGLGVDRCRSVFVPCTM